MEEENNNPEQGSIVKSTTNQAKNRAIKKGTEKAVQKVSKEATEKVVINVAKKSTLATAVPAFIIIGTIVLAVVLAVGVATFLITMPGLAINKLDEFAYDIGSGIASFFGEDTTKQVDEDEIYMLLDYLDDMGYDLKGYGFLTDYMTESDVPLSNGYLDEKLGVIRYEEDTETTVKGKSYTREADSIEKAKSQFLFNYMVSDNYIYTVKNFNLNTESGEGEWYDKVFSFGKGIFIRAIDGTLLGHLLDLPEQWGKGMIALYHEGNGIGRQGAYYENSLFSNVKVDYEKKTLELKKGLFSKTYEYKLDGWTGRYGIPTEFLLSVHLGTMMPDLATDLGTSFPTEIVMLLHRKNWEDEQYIPYISKVQNHWYRDVYFVKEDKEFVQTDLEYENLTKERWTLYETNDNGDYKLYAINSKGDYAENISDIRNHDKASDKLEKQDNGYILFKGTKDEADTLDIDVTKKAITENYTAEKYKDIGWSDESGIWTAYVEKDDNTLEQVGEGLRSETNSVIKKLFLYNTYFRYDGSPETAQAITQLRQENNLKYGAIDISIDLSDGTDKLKDIKTDVKLDDGSIKTYSLADVTGKVVINQDSLNAFNMLENMNSLDADYIYRDFKELVVELGYFKKEELAEETPRLLGWPVPETGSLRISI